MFPFVHEMSARKNPFFAGPSVELSDNQIYFFPRLAAHRNPNPGDQPRNLVFPGGVPAQTYTLWFLGGVPAPDFGHAIEGMVTATDPDAAAGYARDALALALMGNYAMPIDKARELVSGSLDTLTAEVLSPALDAMLNPKG